MALVNSALQTILIVIEQTRRSQRSTRVSAEVKVQMAANFVFYERMLTYCKCEPDGSRSAEMIEEVLFLDLLLTFCTYKDDPHIYRSIRDLEEVYTDLGNILNT